MIRECAPRERFNAGIKMLDYRTLRKEKINIKDMVPLTTGSLPSIKTGDHVVNGIINKGAKIFLPKAVVCNRYTPLKNLPYVQRMVEGGILEKVEKRPLNTVLLFPVPKTDPRNPRMILDFSAFTQHLQAPHFDLPNVNTLFKKASNKDLMIKLDLTNGFFHIPLHSSAQTLMGIKCGKTYYKLKKLPQGLSTSPYLMQRTIKTIITTLLKDIKVKSLIYLDDILLMGERGIRKG
jgi:hypothetical protein